MNTTARQTDPGTAARPSGERPGADRRAALVRRMGALALLVGALGTSLSGCVVAPMPYAYTPQGSAVYVGPGYPAPGVDWAWQFQAGWGWGWHHPHHGWRRGRH